MIKLIKYQLYSEYNNMVIYGTDPLDAVNRQKTFRRPKHQDGEKAYGIKMIANLVDTPDLVIKQAIEVEDTSDSRRGSDVYIRVVAETVDGKIVGIDMAEVKMGRPTVGDEMLTGITVPTDLKKAIEKKAKELGISEPDVRRAAYEAFVK
jgi:hypothetical protein